MHIWNPVFLGDDDDDDDDYDDDDVWFSLIFYRK